METELAQALKQWEALQPLSPEDEAKVWRKFMLDFNYNSNHIEGNTLTYGQTELLLLLGEVSGEAPMRHFEEMKAHKVCLDIIRQEARQSQPLTEAFIRSLHRVMLREDYQLPVKTEMGGAGVFTIQAGVYKTRPNSVVTPSGEVFSYASPQETPALMGELVSWYNSQAQTGKLSPIELAALMHYRYIRIHPFEDGNGRMARLLVNYILIQHSWPTIVIKTRDKSAYLNALTKTDVAVGPSPYDGAMASLPLIQPFLSYMQRSLVSSINGYLTLLNPTQQHTWWHEGELISFKTPTPSRILSLLSENPDMTLAALSQELGINRSAVQKQLSSMQKNGWIARPQGKKRGWKVNAKTLAPN